MFLLFYILISLTLALKKPLSCMSLYEFRSFLYTLVLEAILLCNMLNSSVAYFKPCFAPIVLKSAF